MTSSGASPSSRCTSTTSRSASIRCALTRGRPSTASSGTSTPAWSARWTRSSGSRWPEMGEAVSEKTLRRWAEALAGVARTGIGFTDSLFERERYEEVLRIAGDIKVAADVGLEGVPDAQGNVVEWMRD